MCNLDTHDLNACHNTLCLIDKQKSLQKKRLDSREKPLSSNNPPKTLARAGRNFAATLGQSAPSNGDDIDSNYSGLEYEVTAGNAVASLSTLFNPTASSNANIEYGCSMSMTPHVSSFEDPKIDNTPVHLANHLVVEATHRGIARLPIKGRSSIETLVVPSLHEPLLSVAGLCDAGLTVVFTKDAVELLWGE